MKICWVKILTAVAGGSTGAYVVSPPYIVDTQGHWTDVQSDEVGFEVKKNSVGCVNFHL